MDLQEARKWVSQGEGYKVEFKRKAAHPEKIIKEIVAFTNSSGGNLFLGVNDDGLISGLKFPEDEIFAMNTAINKWIRPAPIIQHDIIRLNEKKSIVVYTVLPGHKKPYWVVEGPKKKTAFIRVEDKSIQASKEVREIIRRQCKNKDIQFTYGEKERILMDYLAKHNEISLPTFKNIANLNYYRASKTLILLVLANVLSIIPNDKGDIYCLKNNY